MIANQEPSTVAGANVRDINHGAERHTPNVRINHERTGGNPRG